METPKYGERPDLLMIQNMSSWMEPHDGSSRINTGVYTNIVCQFTHKCIGINQEELHHVARQGSKNTLQTQ